MPDFTFRPVVRASEIDQIRDFIAASGDDRVAVPRSGRIDYLKSEGGKVFALEAEGSFCGSIYTAPLCENPLTECQEVGGIFFAEAARGLRVVAGGNELCGLSTFVVRLATTYAILEWLDAIGRPDVPLPELPEPVSICYTTAEIAEGSRIIGRKLGFCGPGDERPDSTYQNWIRSPAIADEYRRRVERKGHENFQFANLARSAAAELGSFLAGALASGNEFELRHRDGSARGSLRLHRAVTFGRNRPEFLNWLGGGTPDIPSG